MGSYREVIVGTDGSATAGCAVLAAATVARAAEATLTIATAWYRDLPDAPVPSLKVEYPGGSPGAHEARWAEQTTQDAAVAARGAGLADVRAVTPQGNAAEALLELAEARRDSLIVVGTVGLAKASERMLGNIPHQVTHHSIRDVLLVNTQGCEHGYQWRRIGLATDGSSTAAVAVQHGLTLAEALGSTPVLVTVASSETRGQEVLDRAASELEDGASLDRHVEVDRDPVDGLIAASRSVDLLVLGNKGMSGPSRLLGSVANKVTHVVPTDLLLVNTTR